MRFESPVTQGFRHVVEDVELPSGTMTAGDERDRVVGRRPTSTPRRSTIRWRSGSTGRRTRTSASRAAGTAASARTSPAWSCAPRSTCGTVGSPTTASRATPSSCTRSTRGAPPPAARVGRLIVVTTKSDDTMITDEMLRARRQADRHATSFPIGANDIRRWAIAIYYPEAPPRLVLGRRVRGDHEMGRHRRARGVQPVRVGRTGSSALRAVDDGRDRADGATSSRSSASNHRPTARCCSRASSPTTPRCGCARAT